jgi:hypothetical protein
MNKEIIEKVLRCRASIDRHRNWLADKFAESEAAIALAISKLPEKDRDSEARIAEIAMAEKIPDHDRAVDVERMLVQLQAEGFAGIDEYAKWDNEKCLEAYLEYAPIEGKCDRCEGYKGVPPCQAKWGDKVCPEHTLESAKKYVFSATFRSSNKEKREAFSSTLAREAVTLCPEGHGFHGVKDRKGTDKELFPFDLHWQVFE